MSIIVNDCMMLFSRIEEQCTDSSVEYRYMQSISGAC